DQVTLDYFGLALETLKNWQIMEVVHPDDIEHTIAAHAAAHASGESYNVESRHRRADGVYRWFNVLGLPLRDQAGRILRWFHLQIDIDDRKRAEKALRTRESDAQSMLDGIPVGAAIVGADGRPEALNRHMSDYFGARFEGWDSTPSIPRENDLARVIHPDDVERVVAAIQRSMATGEARETEQRL